MRSAHPSRVGDRRFEAGFTLMEAIVATLVSVIAISGLAWSFGQGRAMITAYELERVADATAQASMEWLGSIDPGDANLAIGAHAGVPFVFQNETIGQTGWRVDLADPSIPGHVGVHRLSVVVRWTFGGEVDSLVYDRMVAVPS